MRPRHPDKGPAFRLQWDDDDGGFTVLQGELKQVPHGWVETDPGRFEPQWPSCRKRGLSKRCNNGVPEITIHCNQLHTNVDFNTCATCTFAAPRGHRSTDEFLHEIHHDDGEITNLSPLPDLPTTNVVGGPEFPTEQPVSEETRQKKLAAAEKMDSEWPACKFRVVTEGQGCCPKLRCTCPGHVKEGKAVTLSVCTKCEERST